MKNPERVAELLAELRELAENDFERHRIGVLERDLTAPPQVEQIDDRHQLFNGVLYNKEKNEHYYGKLSIQRAVWLYYNGVIPAGCHIHHVDEKPGNNKIENLRCVTKAEHRTIHHLSTPATIITCKVCKREFKTSAINPSHFCSKHCRLEHEKSLRGEKRKCIICGTEFICDRNAKTKTCSKNCALKMRYQNHIYKPKTEQRTCIICGKTFTCCKSKPTKTCSPSCARKLRWQKSRHSNNVDK